MLNFQTVISNIVAELQTINQEAAAFGQAILTFLSIAGPTGLKVATDIATDVATKTVTPSQAVSQLQDVAAFSTAVNAAIVTIKADASA
jgi:hypothetical protein